MDNKNWTEIKVTVPVEHIDIAGDIANMTVPYGIYIEDYSDLEEGAMEIAHIDLIDEQLLNKDRTKAWIHIYISPEENPMEAVSFLKERYISENIPYEINIDSVNMQDWANNWKKYFKPLPIGEKLLIQPTWLKDEKTDRLMLHIDPGLAFGTGGHNTTKLCLEQLEKVIKPGMDILDVGCGSGILSIASLLLGAKTATGVDIDALAVKTAIENGKINGFLYPQYNIIQGNLTDKISGKYDIVVANIVADIIIKLCGDVKQYMHPDSLFIVSGIVDIREDDVISAFNENGFDIVSRNEEGGWICFSLKIK